MPKHVRIYVQIVQRGFMKDMINGKPFGQPSTMHEMRQFICTIFTNERKRTVREVSKGIAGGVHKFFWRCDWEGNYHG